jgi:hypothetical protein
MEYTPRPICLKENSSPVQIFVIWAGHRDPDRLPSMLLEAKKILKEDGPHTQRRTDQEWLNTPRESFDSGGWAEMVGKENVECPVIDPADHDSMMDPEVVCLDSYTFFSIINVGFSLTLVTGSIYRGFDANRH